MPKTLGKLKNNKIKYVIETNKCMNTTTVMVTIKTGSRNESENVYGISHLIEHLLFQGTNNFSNKEMNKVINMNGGSSNGSTTSTKTNYYINIPNEKSEVAFVVLADMLYNSLFSNINKEKSVVLNEIITWKKKSIHMLLNEFSKLLYKNTVLEHYVGGTEKSIAKISMNDILSYYNKYYVDTNIVLSIAGNLSNRNIKKYLEYFNNKFIKRQVKKKYNFKSTFYKNFYKKQNGFRFKYIKKNEAQTLISLGFPSYSRGNDKNYILLLLSLILVGIQSSKLTQEIREEKGLCYSLQDFSFSTYDTGAFHMVCGTFNKVQKINEVLTIIFKHLEQIKNYLTIDELNLFKNYVVLKNKSKSNNSLDVSEFNANNLLFYNKYIPLASIINKIKKIKLTDVKNVAKEIFQINKLNLCILGPVKFTKQHIINCFKSFK